MYVWMSASTWKWCARMTLRTFMLWQFNEQAIVRLVICTFDLATFTHAALIASIHTSAHVIDVFILVHMMHANHAWMASGYSTVL